MTQLEDRSMEKHRRGRMGASRFSGEFKREQRARVGAKEARIAQLSRELDIDRADVEALGEDRG